MGILVSFQALVGYVHIVDPHTIVVDRELDLGSGTIIP